MKNIYTILYGIVITLVIIIFLGLYGVLKIEEPMMEDINTSILNNIDLTKMVEGDAKKLRQLYYINKSQVEDFILYAPKTNMEAEEILVLKVKDEKEIEELRGKIKTRVDKQSKSFENYRPELKKVIDDYELKEKGQYLYLIISEDSNKINKALEKNF